MTSSDCGSHARYDGIFQPMRHCMVGNRLRACHTSEPRRYRSFQSQSIIMGEYGNHPRLYAGNPTHASKHAEHSWMRQCGQMRTRIPETSVFMRSRDYALMPASAASIAGEALEPLGFAGMSAMAAMKRWRHVSAGDGGWRLPFFLRALLSFLRNHKWI